jgi:hypothetical protein
VTLDQLKAQHKRVRMAAITWYTRHLPWSAKSEKMAEKAFEAWWLDSGLAKSLDAETE